MTVGEFFAAAHGYCLTFAASMTSGTRTPDRNTRVGGVPRSAHLFGLGCDVVYDGSPPGPAADEWLLAHGLRRIVERDHDHLMPSEWLP